MIPTIATPTTIRRPLNAAKSACQKPLQNGHISTARFPVRLGISAGVLALVALEETGVLTCGTAGFNAGAPALGLANTGARRLRGWHFRMSANAGDSQGCLNLHLQKRQKPLQNGHFSHSGAGIIVALFPCDTVPRLIVLGTVGEKAQ
jgi:hypothetical protein